MSLFVILPGLTEPVLIRLDVDSKLSDQIKVKRKKEKKGVFSYHLRRISFFGT